MYWLDRYGTDYHRWQLLPNTTSETWYRPVGLVEGMFDKDGTDCEGRADINTLLEAELSTNISTEALRRKVLLAWTVLRFQHLLLSARALCRKDFLSDAEGAPNDRFLVVRKPEDVDGMVKEASRTMGFVEDHYSQIDVEDFYTHVMNTARVFDSSNDLARFFTLPPKPLADGRLLFQAVSVVAHEIADALSIYRWHAHFLDLLNTPTSTLAVQASRLCSASSDLQARLPHAQEDLYPPIPGNRARQRWFWAISRILRHTRSPPPPSFPNPLRRQKPLKTAEAMPPRYPALLDYSKTPPLNTYSAAATLSPRTTSRIQSLCRSAHISIGSGAFALVALVMMILREKQLQKQQQQAQSQPPTSPQDGSQSSSPLPFVASFPLDPRPFLTLPTTGRESSLVLSFSDGLTLPFLPSTLPLEARFLLLARRAHRQLRVYQKRKPSPSLRPAETREVLGSRSTAQMLPQLYLFGVERAMGLDVQGAYPVKTSIVAEGADQSDIGLGATCGVSSIGDQTGLIAPLPEDRRHHGRSGRSGHGGDDGNPTSEPKGEAGPAEDFASFSFTNIRCTVRAREGEFLVGSAGDQRGLSFNVSFDGCAIERERVEAEWRGLMEGLFEGLDLDLHRRDVKDGGKEEEEEEEEKRRREGERAKL